MYKRYDDVDAVTQPADRFVAGCAYSETVEIPLPRYEQLIRAEQDGERLKRLLFERVEKYRPFEMQELRVLAMLFGYVEEQVLPNVERS